MLTLRLTTVLEIKKIRPLKDESRQFLSEKIPSGGCMFTFLGMSF